MPQSVAPIKVLLVDDHEHVLWGLRKLIDGEWPRMMVAGTARTMAQALAGVRDRKPDVVVLDLLLGDENALDRLPELVSEGGPAVLVLSGTGQAELHRRAVASGARAVVTKDQPADLLLREIQRIYELRDAGVIR